MEACERTSGCVRPVMVVAPGSTAFPSAQPGPLTLLVAALFAAAANPVST